MKLARSVFSKLHEMCCSWVKDFPLRRRPQIYYETSIHAIKNMRRKMEDKHVCIPDFNMLFNLEVKGIRSGWDMVLQKRTAVLSLTGWRKADCIRKQNCCVILNKFKSFQIGNIVIFNRFTWFKIGRVKISSGQPVPVQGSKGSYQFLWELLGLFYYQPKKTIISK